MMPRDRRALIRGTIAVAGLFVLLRGVPMAFRKIGTLREDVEQETRRVTRLRAELAAVGALEDSSRVAKRRLLALAPRILAGASAGETQADLIGRVSTLAAAHRVTVDRTDPLPDSIHAAALHRVALRVAVTGDSRGTIELLRAIEGDPVVMTIEEPRIAAPDPVSADAVPERVQTEFVLRAWYLAGPSTDGSHQ